MFLWHFLLNVFAVMRCYFCRLILITKILSSLKLQSYVLQTHACSFGLMRARSRHPFNTSASWKNNSSMMSFNIYINRGEYLSRITNEFNFFSTRYLSINISFLLIDDNSITVNDEKKKQLVCRNMRRKTEQKIVIVLKWKLYNLERSMSAKKLCIIIVIIWRSIFYYLAAWLRAIITIESWNRTPSIFFSS